MIRAAPDESDAALFVREAVGLPASLEEQGGEPAKLFVELLSKLMALGGLLEERCIAACAGVTLSAQAELPGKRPKLLSCLVGLGELGGLGGECLFVCHVTIICAVVSLCTPPF